MMKRNAYLAIYIAANNAMPWPGPQLHLILLLLILAILGPPGFVAEGNVGCLFSERICLEEEWCFDDEAFGRCLPKVGDLNEDDFFRYNLQQEALHDFSKEIRRLFALGYRWGHSYTQCRLQGMLFTLRNQLEYELDSCSHLSDNDLEGALRALEGQVQLDPQEVAIIKYTPSVDNPHADFADEVYYPPADNTQQEEIRRNILGIGESIDLDIPDPLLNYGVTKRTWLPPMRRRSNTPFFDGRYGVPKYRRIDNEPLDSIEFLHEYENEYPEPKPPEYRVPFAMEENGQDFPEEEMYRVIKLLHQLQLPPKEIQQYLSPSNYNKLRKILNRYKQMSDDEPPDDILINELLKHKFEPPEDELQDFGPDERFTLTYNTPDKFREGWESRDEVRGDELPEPRIYYDEEQDPQSAMNTEYGSGHADEIFSERNLEFLKPREIFRELKQRQEQENENFNKKWKIKPVVYSEGGAEPEDIGEIENQQEIALRDDLNIWDRYNMGFKRPERLDVKKPGPPFDPAITEIAQKALGTHHYPQNKIIPSMMKKEPRGAHPNPNSNYISSGKREGADDQYVHVEFKEILKNWKQGKDIIKNIFNLLHMEQTDYIDGQVHMQSVSFSVANNSRGYNASEVARKIELIKDDLENLTGVEVVSAGLGNKVKMQNVLFTRINPESQYIVIFLVCGVLVALILATIVLSLIRKHIKFRDKLKGLSRPDTEASKDYQDLCRARMATKGQATEGAPDKGRITSLSRESEQSPSSRSSTSSWSEEPALHNMDISTGHMVLSYMEDHLKNKDRLDQEWIALCAYVAEPCETSIAMKKDNVEKNRYREVIPYDHARVILNELTNANGSDYINGSSITDHDPRNPAYIATQGPLPHTAADFWQLIWEQGAVVIVMLTRLTEGGTAMCHRYWPEEGSEVYHIYEVHLVSEHIWCDDYLVRSFYLKNVRTGETRTVTQFHFLSWPEAGVPGSTKALLEFRRKVNKSYRGRSCPIVVHCSDGAGRTGTYCLIDMVLSRMAKGAKEIDIAATLEHLRDQRPKMVATKQQFEFVLTAVAEEVHAILKALPPQPSPASQTTQDKPENK